MDAGPQAQTLGVGRIGRAQLETPPAVHGVEVGAAVTAAARQQMLLSRHAGFMTEFLGGCFFFWMQGATV